MKNKNTENTDSLFSAKSKKDVIRSLNKCIGINALNEYGQNALFFCNSSEATQAMLDAGINTHHLDNRAETHYSITII